LERFRQIVERQGGDPRVVDDYGRFPQAPRQIIVAADRAGFVTDLHAERIGIGTVMLGAGRTRAEDAVDPAVGAVVRARVGDPVRAGEAILEVHYRDDATLAAAMSVFRSAFAVGDQPPTVAELILEEVR
jgi:pyrimidine-nucleoside phosphorylase